MTPQGRWISMLGVGAVLALVYREVRQRAELLRQAITEDDRVTQALEDTFPASDAVSYTPGNLRAKG
jgi:hypothetical protein